jgi:23S rRNA (pseudouridine1915-N3)-methyltransferase
MIKVEINAIGSIRESYLKDGIEEYKKRLQKFCDLTIREYKEIKIPDKASSAQMEQIKKQESSLLFPVLKKEGYFLMTAIQGREQTSEQLAELLKNATHQGRNPICFFVGGSLGLSEEIYTKADEKISFSKMTFPHQLFRLILLEQIYRAFKIMNQEAYHK